MTYEEAIQFWFGRVNYEQKSPQVGDFKLERMRQLHAFFGDPHRRLRIVHIAGSKGKGSTSALLASILQHEGYRVGLFTSPHLVAVEERIQVDQQPIDKNELAALLGEIRAGAPASFLEELTFFEIGTLVGFLHFVRRRVDFTVVEVGLGGRFDSTNVCDPLFSIITSISYDHTQILGDTLAKIAFEKAGIVKPGRATISGVRDAEARRVIEDVCAERGSPLRQLEVDFRCEHTPAMIAADLERLPSVAVTTRRRRWHEMTVGLIGEHQARNAAVAIAAVEELIERGVPIGERAVANGLARVSWPARLEILARKPFVLLDCAHNVSSARALVQALTVSFPQSGQRLLIFGGNRDKDLAGMLELLAVEFDRIYLTSFHGSARCLPAAQLAALLPAEKRRVSIECAEPREAWRLARAEAKPGDLICVTGSVFLAGELRPVIVGG
ncbi:MAG: bifunctional folylpolyglutamate synthase/dihydrofolate synthase [Gemmataceae bacterium]|nr:bifunctional folylpolyglutamate synthase/dihydrofolate synthase [Gemmataceae bacterium]